MTIKKIYNDEIEKIKDEIKEKKEREEKEPNSSNQIVKGSNQKKNSLEIKKTKLSSYRKGRVEKRKKMKSIISSNQVKFGYEGSN